MIYRNTDISASEIRQALIDFAVQSGRPLFEVYVVKQVIEAFRTNQPHDLKDIVFTMVKSADSRLNTLNPTLDTEQNRIKKIKRAYLSYKFNNLFSAKKIEEAYVINIIRGRENLTTETWNILVQFI